MRSFACLPLFLLAGSLFGQSVRGVNRPYSVSADLHEVANLRAFRKAVGLQPEHLSLLHKNLFVVTANDNIALESVYGTNDYRNLPSLVTVDASLHLYHVFFDATLRVMEQDKLLPMARRLTAGMLRASIADLDAAKDPGLRQAALKNVAYFAVASDLLGAKPQVPTAAAKLAAGELAKIKGAKGFEMSSIFPYKIDYSQFIVRGHYTKTPALGRYFQGMMWYGLVPFALQAAPNGPTATEQVRQALLIVRDLFSGGLSSQWQAIYEPTTLYSGASDKLTPSEIGALSRKVFGAGAPASAFADPAKLASFVRQLAALRPARIQSRRVGAGQPNAALQFRFMGQRYIPDSEILQSLSGDERIMPSGLDVMAVLGSARAASILDASPAKYNPRGWPAYRPTRDRLRQRFAALPPATWRSNLYWGWLYAIDALLKPVDDGYPSFMRSSAYQDRYLSTSLASWAELRHDTLLYGTQSVSEMGGDETPPPPFVKGYVEPNVALYGRLLDLCKLTRVGLEKRKLLTEFQRERFSKFEALLGFFRSVSVKELRNQPLTRSEHKRIRYIEGELTELDLDMLQLGVRYTLTADDQDIALVADVHTGAGNALTAATGHADDLIAIVPIEGKLYLARGSALSYYEFEQPISQRMTDKQWHELLDDHQAPPRPAWVRTYLSPKEAKDKGG